MRQPGNYPGGSLSTLSGGELRNLESAVVRLRRPPYCLAAKSKASDGGPEGKGVEVSLKEAEMDPTRQRILLAREARKVNTFLFVCSLNRGRSATAEHVARTLGYWADSAGTHSVSVRALSLEAIERAEFIVCMEERHEKAVLMLAPHRKDDIDIWYIPDLYRYGDPDLVTLIKAHLQQAIPRRSYGATG